jgi:hypothetical protein
MSLVDHVSTRVPLRAGLVLSALAVAAGLSGCGVLSSSSSGAGQQTAGAGQETVAASGAPAPASVGAADCAKLPAPAKAQSLLGMRVKGPTAGSASTSDEVLCTYALVVPASETDPMKQFQLSMNGTVTVRFLTGMDDSGWDGLTSGMQLVAKGMAGVDAATIKGLGDDAHVLQFELGAGVTQTRIVARRGDRAVEVAALAEPAGVAKLLAASFDTWT